MCPGLLPRNLRKAKIEPLKTELGREKLSNYSILHGSARLNIDLMKIISP